MKIDTVTGVRRKQDERQPGEGPGSFTADGKRSSRGDCRALVPLSRAPQRRRHLVRFMRAAAPFLTQLVATRLDLPQTWQRRRASAGETIARYECAERLAGAATSGVSLRKVI